ncbi:MAG TPA: hypothetical protein CFH80_07760 [Sulfurospirillum cavolei]|uniref:Uncharacterized protein n=1 Tax=Sulfurospirillum cavolei TaxID=366522 RepID=A0A2D3WC67_9BACT|nr:MAG TPA: hypothetical protein CFH80_07760 [Sulfurospirillum cavolei]
MNLTYDTINILLILIPGFISSIIFRQFHNKEKFDNYEKTIEALVFSVIIYIILILFDKWQPLAFKDGDIKIPPFINLLLTIIFMIVIPMLIGFILYKDWHMKLFRFMKLTNKTSRSTAWEDTFEEQKKFIIVHFKDGRRLSGTPMYYSNNEKGIYLYLHNPAWITAENEIIELPEVHGTLISKENIDFIEFQNNNI